MTKTDAVAAVLDRIDRRRVEDLLVRLLEQYSPSFSEEPAMEVLAEQLHDADLTYLRQPVSEREHGQDDGNLVVELGPAPAAVLWVGHVDTVPPADDELLVPRLEGDLLHGLGSADMKSGCAAMLEALIAVRESGIPLSRRVAAAFVVGEEESGDGSKALVERWSAPVTLIGEPTSLRAATEHYGYWEYRLTTEGSRVHAALPELGGSAIHAMLAWLTGICEAAPRAHRADRLAVNPREIGGGGDLFVVAERCEALVDVHAAPDISHTEVAALIEAARTGAAAAHPRCSLQHTLVYDAPGYGAPPAPVLAPIARAFERASEHWMPVAFRSHSDAPIFEGKGSTTLLCGPGALEVAHTRHEHVSMDEVVRAARLYAAIICEMCA